MIGMTTQERINDICQISGLSEEIVRRVMDAERKSVAKSLRKGERANLIGRAVIRPEIKRKLLIGGEFESYIKLSITPASSLESMLDGLKEFETQDEKMHDDKGIRLNQILALT